MPALTCCATSPIHSPITLSAAAGFAMAAPNTDSTPRPMVSFLRRNKTTVGLDIGSGFIKVAVVDHSGPEPELVHVSHTPLIADAIVEGEVMDPQIVVETIRSLMDSSGRQGQEAGRLGGRPRRHGQEDPDGPHEGGGRARGDPLGGRAVRALRHGERAAGLPDPGPAGRRAADERAAGGRQARRGGPEGGAAARRGAAAGGHRRGLLRPAQRLRVQLPRRHGGRGRAGERGPRDQHRERAAGRRPGADPRRALRLAGGCARTCAACTA